MIVVAETDAASTDEQGLLSTVDYISSLLQLGLVRPGHRFMNFFYGEADIFFIHGNKKNIWRQFQKYGAWTPQRCLSESRGHVFRDAVNIVACSALFGNRLDNIDLIHFLEGPGVIIPQRMPATKNHQRRAI